jgi:hypothetical protein
MLLPTTFEKALAKMRRTNPQQTPLMLSVYLNAKG